MNENGTARTANNPDRLLRVGSPAIGRRCRSFFGMFEGPRLRETSTDVVAAGTEERIPCNARWTVIRCLIAVVVLAGGDAIGPAGIGIDEERCRRGPRHSETDVGEKTVPGIKR